MSGRGVATLLLIPFVVAAIIPAIAQPDGTRLDGSWTVAIACPARTDDTEARGYSYKFPAVVKNGVLHGQRRTQGSPGSLTLDGTIQPDGSADIDATGYTGHPDYAVKHLSSGMPYSYRIKARFEGSRGTGTRLEQRACTFTFVKD